MVVACQRHDRLDDPGAPPVRRPGLTLVETLAATVLLAVLAVAVAGLCAQAARIPARPSAECYEFLRLAVDELMNAPEWVRSVAAAPELPASLPSRLDGSSVHVRRHAASGGAHAWIVFESHGVAVARWVALGAERSERRP